MSRQRGRIPESDCRNYHNNSLPGPYYSPLALALPHHPVPSQAERQSEIAMSTREVR